MGTPIKEKLHSSSFPSLSFFGPPHLPPLVELKKLISSQNHYFYVHFKDLKVSGLSKSEVICRNVIRWFSCLFLFYCTSWNTQLPLRYIEKLKVKFNVHLIFLSPNFLNAPSIRPTCFISRVSKQEALPRLRVLESLTCATRTTWIRFNWSLLRRVFHCIQKEEFNPWLTVNIFRLPTMLHIQFSGWLRL